MLKDVLEDAGLQPESCANLLGVNPQIFLEWVRGTRPIPSYFLPELSSVLGIDPNELSTGSAKKASGVWFKFSEGDKLIDADREVLVLIRKLGHFLNELEDLTDTQSSAWKVSFDIVKQDWKKLKSLSPIEQGDIAAKVFRRIHHFGHSVIAQAGRISAMGDVIRPMLRNLGILVIESPIPGSNLEGCSFYVGNGGSERPCLFVNSYRQSWFRRNEVLIHELAHAIFDIDNDAATLDYKGDPNLSDLRESRADTFARHTLVPAEVLKHLTSTQGLNWDALMPHQLASLVACTEVELRTVLNAAVDAGFCTAEHAVNYRKASIQEELKSLTERALTTREFIAKLPKEEVAPWLGGRRTTTIPSRSLRLPVPYVKKVLEAIKSDLISVGRGAEMLMMDKEDFLERFSEFEGVAA